MKIDYVKLDAALDLAKRQRAGGTEYTLNAVTIGDVEELIRRSKIVDDLAMMGSPAVSEEGQCGSECALCGANVGFFDEDPTHHEPACVWRRAIEAAA